MSKGGFRGGGEPDAAKRGRQGCQVSQTFTGATTHLVASVASCSSQLQSHRKVDVVSRRYTASKNCRKTSRNDEFDFVSRLRLSAAVYRPHAFAADSSRTKNRLLLNSASSRTTNRKQRIRRVEATTCSSRMSVATMNVQWRLSSGLTRRYRAPEHCRPHRYFDMVMVSWARPLTAGLLVVDR